MVFAGQPCDALGDNLVLHQAANEGFRGVYAVCFEGPDAGKGFAVLSNGDNRATLLNAEIMQAVLLGARNAVDPEVQRDQRQKYKGHEQ